MPAKRQVFEALNRNDLLLAIDACDLEVHDRRRKDGLVDTLDDDSVDLAAVLADAFSRDRLKGPLPYSRTRRQKTRQGRIAKRLLSPAEPMKKPRSTKEPRTTQPSAPAAADPPWGPLQGRPEDASVLENRLWGADDESPRQLHQSSAPPSTPPRFSASSSCATPTASSREP